MRRQRIHGFTLVELMVVIGILGLLVGILAVAVLPKLMSAKSELEKKQLGDLHQALQQAQADTNNNKKFKGKAMKTVAGRAFYEQCFKQGILQRDLLSKIVSLNSEAGDSASDSAWIDEGGELDESGCSYTSPKGEDFSKALNASGKDKCVVVAFDSRNWNNYKDKGVIVAWSEGGVDYIEATFADSEYGISAGDWERPGDAIIGTKKPFHRTYEK